MMTKPIVFILLLLAVALGVYHEYFYPPTLLKHQVQQALEQVARAVETHDRAKISEALAQQLGDDAHITLNVEFRTVGQPEGNTKAQEFSKADFIRFIDNIAYSLTTYHFEPSLDSFSLDSARQGAVVTFSSRSWAEGVSYYGGVGLDMRYTMEATCSGHVMFAQPALQLDKADCKIELGVVPKPGQEDKLRNPEVLRELL